ncbi:MAG TPA: methylmalonyl-CoA mutase family protein [Caulobacteraceae bacterium]
MPFSADFPAATEAQWRDLVRKTLKGAPIETLTSHTIEGLEVAPLYTAANARPPMPFEPAPRVGERPWDLRALVEHPDPAIANDQILQALEGGAASVLLRVGAEGRAGVAINDAEAMARALDGVITEVAAVALDAGFLGLKCAQWLASAAKAAPAARLEFHLDPLSSFAREGASPGPIKAHVEACADAAASLATTYPRARLFLAAGQVVHEAGGGEAEELAFAMAAAVAYAKALVSAGLPLSRAFGAIAVGLAVDADVVLSMAKLRAARVLWRQITRACGTELPVRLEALSSGRMLTRADAWTNLVRLTLADFAAAAGGADVIALGSFTAALGAPTPFALRQARNIQLILMEEAGVGRVADPGAGAWSVESLTFDLAHAAWDNFTAIEAAGDLIEALTSGLIADRVGETRAALAAGLACGAMKIVGVTDYRGDDDPPAVETLVPTVAGAPDPGLPGPDSACRALAPIRLEALAQ